MYKRRFLLYITGSRSFNDKELLTQKVEAAIEQLKGQPFCILVGPADGAERLSLELATERKWEIANGFESIEDWKERADAMLHLLAEYEGNKSVLLFNNNTEGSNYIEQRCQELKIPHMSI